MSWYQQLKPVLTNFLDLSKDAIHIHIGFVCLVITLLIIKRKLNSWPVLLPGFIVSLIMEIMDLRDDYVYGGNLNFSASLHDLVNTNLIPLILVFLAQRKLV